MKRLVLRIVIVALAMTGSTVLALPQQHTAGSSLPAAPVPDGFSGFWDYNSELSVDAATGRPEQAPRSAAQRSLANAAPPAAPAARGGGGRAGGGGGATGGDGQPRSDFDEARRAMAAIIAAERRTLIRDLLEVPEKLTITAAGRDVTFVDDLKRSRTYVADGKSRKYQIAAARFEARTGWDGKYFRKDIEGPNDFRMSETYFLSEDSQRLFVIIRIGDPRRPETMAGVNRVYDRVTRSTGAPGA